MDRMCLELAKNRDVIHIEMLHYIYSAIRGVLNQEDAMTFVDCGDALVVGEFTLIFESHDAARVAMSSTPPSVAECKRVFAFILTAGFWKVNTSADA